MSKRGKPNIPVPCTNCGTVFLRYGSERRCCSLKCAEERIHLKKKMRTCVNCGGGFVRDKHHSKRKTCSEECANKLLKSHNDRMIAEFHKPCIACGHFCKKYRSGGHYVCSKECWLSIKPKEPREQRHCVQCQRLYMARSNQRFCSRMCNNIFWTSLKQDRRIRNCKQCGEAFVPIKGRVFCSTVCGELGYKKMNAANAKKYNLKLRVADRVVRSLLEGKELC